MIIRILEENNIKVAKLEDYSRFTLAITEDVKADLKPLLTENGTKLIFDLEGIEFIDSSGIGCIISLVKTAKSNNSVIKLCNLSPEVAKVFNLLHLEKILDIEKDLESCLKSF